MSAPAVIAAAHKSPAPAPSPSPNPTGTLTTKMADAGNWFSDHSGVIISDAIAIASIIIVALVLRKVTLTFIKRAVDRAAMRAESKPGRFLETGLLMGAERRMQRTRALGGVLGSIASVTIMVIAVLMIIDQLHISTGPILA